MPDPIKTLFTRIERQPLTAFGIFLIVIVGVRLIALGTSQLDLGPDETQYWFWAQSPAFGYFSKPPMIAWLIGATTGLFGDASWAVRLASPLLHGGTACFLFALTHHLYDRKIAFWAGTGWLIMPGIAFSSTLMTTDVPLLFFWSGALYIFALIMVERTPRFGEPSLGLGVMLGVFMGLGFLSKYAMVYFLIALLITVIVSGRIKDRRVWQTLSVALGVMIVLLIPNVIWNQQHDFQTLSHTADNANWGADLFNPDELGEFLVSQIGIAGPITLGAFLVFLVVGLRNRALGDLRLLLAFALNPLFIVSVQAFLSRAHANWAAAAYPAVLIMVTVWLYKSRRFNLLFANHALHLIISVALAIGLSNLALADGLGLSNAVKRVRGWEAQGAVVAKAAAQYQTVMADDRELTGQLLYYAGLAERGIIAFNSNNRVDSHYEAFFPFQGTEPGPLLYITQNADAIAVTPMFETVTPLITTTVDLKNGRTRTLYLFEIAGFRGR
ncbi:MAG: glycosyltransferase family 39 protein [Pseudomonadota bacterium]